MLNIKQCCESYRKCIKCYFHISLCILSVHNVIVHPTLLSITHEDVSIYEQDNEISFICYTP